MLNFTCSRHFEIITMTFSFMGYSISNIMLSVILESNIFQVLYQLQYPKLQVIYKSNWKTVKSFITSNVEEGLALGLAVSSVQR